MSRSEERDLGAKFILDQKEASEVAALRQAYPDIGGTSDYVCYWFRKTHDLLPQGARAGLVGTANIRFGDSRKNTLDYIVDNDGVIVDAVSSQPWSGDASVEVSIVNWTKGAYDGPRTLWLTRGTTKMEVEAAPTPRSASGVGQERTHRRGPPAPQRIGATHGAATRLGQPLRADPAA
jgi:hypothetical protein